MIEVWKDIKGYEGYYQISTHGRVKSVRYNRLLKQNYINDDLSVTFSVNGKMKTRYVVNLIDETFKDHIRLDEIKQRAKLNASDRKDKKNFKPTHHKQIKVIYPDGSVEIWESAAKFAREIGTLQNCIVAVLKGRQQSHRGMKFEYVTEEIK